MSWHQCIHLPVSPGIELCDGMYSGYTYKKNKDYFGALWFWEENREDYPGTDFTDAEKLLVDRHREALWAWVRSYQNATEPIYRQYLAEEGYSNARVEYGIKRVLLLLAYDRVYSHDLTTWEHVQNDRYRYAEESCIRLARRIRDAAGVKPFVWTTP